MDGWTDGQTYGRTDRQTDGWTGGRMDTASYRDAMDASKNDVKGDTNDVIQ